MDVKFLQTRLSAELDEPSANTSPNAEETLDHLCQQCDSSLQFLQSLCQQKLFRECLVKNKIFRKEDMQLSGTEAYMRRSDSLKRAEQRAREESEKLRQQEREIAEKRKRDMTLRARIAAKAEEKKLELLFLRWSEHHKKLGNFIRTKAEPPIYYMFAKPLIKKQLF